MCARHTKGCHDTKTHRTAAPWPMIVYKEILRGAESSHVSCQEMEKNTVFPHVRDDSQRKIVWLFFYLNSYTDIQTARKIQYNLGWLMQDQDLCAKTNNQALAFSHIEIVNAASVWISF